jgi:hypothetical protein
VSFAATTVRRAGVRWRRKRRPGQSGEPPAAWTRPAADSTTQPTLPQQTQNLADLPHAQSPCRHLDPPQGTAEDARIGAHARTPCLARAYDEWRPPFRGRRPAFRGWRPPFPARHPKVVAFRLESVVAFDRNRWSPSTGMGGRLRPEYAGPTATKRRSLMPLLVAKVAISLHHNR